MSGLNDKAFHSVLTLDLLNFFNGIILLPFTSVYHCQGNQDENLKLVSQQYTTWSDCTDVWTVWQMILLLELILTNNHLCNTGLGHMVPLVQLNFISQYKTDCYNQDCHYTNPEALEIFHLLLTTLYIQAYQYSPSSYF